MSLLKLEKLSSWDVVYAFGMALACLVTYCIMTSIFLKLLHEPSDFIDALWAIISTVFVFRDTRANSLSAGISRLIATGVSVLLCLCYLGLFPFALFGLTALLVLGALIMMSVGRRPDIGLTAATTAVIMVVAAIKPHDAWHEPLLRLVDTLIGIAVGVTCKWIASFLFYRLKGEQVR
jgi:uncharacterized membrane protein YgaE (UPF0421/DUF939 family)